MHKLNITIAQENILWGLRRERVVSTLVKETDGELLDAIRTAMLEVISKLLSCQLHAIFSVSSTRGEMIFQNDPPSVGSTLEYQNDPPSAGSPYDVESGEGVDPGDGRGESHH